MPRHAGRCWGYLSSDGTTAFCTEVEGGTYVESAQAWARPYSKNGTGPKVRVRSSSSGQQVARYIYHDEEGAPLFAVDRYETEDGDKEFKQLRWNGTTFVSGIAGVRRVPFHLPQLIAAIDRGEHVYTVEGEKDVLAVEERGAAATCNPMGAGKWHDDFSAFFSGAEVSVIQDDDERGRTHAREVKRSLLRAGAIARLLTPRTGKDATEHFAAGLSLDDFESAERFQPIDLGEIAMNGVQPVAMLTPHLPQRHLVWMAGESGAGKTWIALWQASIVLEAGGKVAVLDEEMGPQETTNRLLLLGVDPETMSERLDYYPFPSIVEDDADEFAALVADRQWDLAIFDTATDFFASAGIAENAGDEVTRWVKAFPEVVRRYGTPLVLDHIPKRGETHGHAVGSRAKRAKAKVAYEVSLIEEPTKDKRGVWVMDKVKDNLSSDAPPKTFLDVGPDDERFTVRPTDETRIKFLGDRGLDLAIVRALRSKELSKNQLEKAVSGWDTRKVRERATALASDPDLAYHGVRSRQGQRNSTIYYIEEHADAED